MTPEPAAAREAPRERREDPAAAVPRRIGLFGGTFDPPHVAHVELARLARNDLRLDEVRWIPAGQPWQKSRVLSGGADREAMVRLAIEGHERFVLDRAELTRSGPSYTLDTVVEMQAVEPQAEWFLLIGADQYATLHTWRDWTVLLSRVVLAVANRPGPLPLVDPGVRHHPHRAVPLPMLDISSTDIRRRVAQGLPIDRLVPPSVARYIDQHSLYKT